MHVLAGALAASLWHGALVALVVYVLRRVWRADAAVQCGLATLGLWVLGAWFVADLGLGAATSDRASVAPSGLVAAEPQWLPWVAGLWSVGVMLGAVRLAGGWWVVHRWVRRSSPLPPQWRARVEAVVAQVRTRQTPRFAVSVDVDSPVVVGVLWPVVLLPASILMGTPAIAATLSPAQVQGLVAHELAHIARADPWFHAVQSTIELLLFHNPAVWWLGREAARAREDACDDQAVAATGDRLEYARALLALELSARPAVALGATGAPLRARIERLVRPSPTPRPRSAALIALAAVALMLGGLMAGSSPSPTRPDEGRLAIAGLPDSVQRHEASIVAAANRHGIDPALLAIVTLVESRGDANATSPVGARGLMQLMPSTAAAVARERGLAPPTDALLSDPDYNLDLGAWFLAQQLQEFGGAAVDTREGVNRAIAAYNAGPSRTRAWLAGERPLPDETLRYQAQVGALWGKHAAPNPRDR